jgi:hypothetical protein
MECLLTASVFRLSCPSTEQRLYVCPGSCTPGRGAVGICIPVRGASSAGLVSAHARQSCARSAFDDGRCEGIIPLIGHHLGTDVSECLTFSRAISSASGRARGVELGMDTLQHIRRGGSTPERDGAVRLSLVRPRWQMALCGGSG